jgi:hypothetical protein
MYSTRKMTLIAGTALIVGAVGGALVGFELSSRFWYRLSRPSIAATGVLAQGLLTPLDKKDESGVRELLERQIDSTLVSLRAEKANGSLTPGDPLVRSAPHWLRGSQPHAPRSGAPHRRRRRRPYGAAGGGNGGGANG